MTAKGNVLCIQKESSPERRQLLEGDGYTVSTAESAESALATLAFLRPDAIVLEYSADSVAAKAVKGIASEVPVVMIVTSLDVPNSAMDSVDALVANYDGPQFLLQTLHFLLTVKPAQKSASERHKAQGFRQIREHNGTPTTRATTAE